MTCWQHCQAAWVQEPVVGAVEVCSVRQHNVWVTSSILVNILHTNKLVVYKHSCTNRLGLFVRVCDNLMHNHEGHSTENRTHSLCNEYKHSTHLKGSRALACCCGACCCCCCTLLLVCVALCEVLPCAAAAPCCLSAPLQATAGTSDSTTVGGGCMSSSGASCAAGLTDGTTASGCLTLPGCVASLRCCCCCCSCVLLRSSCLPLSSAAA